MKSTIFLMGNKKKQARFSGNFNIFIIRSENNYKFILGMMGGLDKERKVIKVNELKFEKKLLRAPTEIPYDTLVLAVGAVPDTFGIPGVKEHCMFLNSPRQADTIRIAMLNQGKYIYAL
jgi:NADH dehydrogenase